MADFKLGQVVYVIEFDYDYDDDIETAEIKKLLFLAECSDYIFLTCLCASYKNINDQLEDMYEESLEEYCVSDIMMAKKEHVFAAYEKADEAMIKILEGLNA